MRIVLVGCIVVLGVLAGVLAHAVEPLLLYDDFNAEQLDAGKWVREEDGAGIKSTVQLQDNRMRLLHRSYGKTDSDKGQDSGGLFLSFVDLAAVTAIKATVQVRRYGDGTLALFHGPRCLARYAADGSAIETTRRAA